MKFILSKSGKSVVNAKHVQAAYVYEVEEMTERGDFVSTGSFKVKVMLCDKEDRISLATFDGDDADANRRAAQKYLAELADKLNAGGTAKFILGKNGKSIVNVEHVQAAYIHEDEDIDENFDVVSTGSFAVKVMFAGEDNRISLATFDGDDADANRRAAQSYFDEFVNELNGGTQ